MRPNPPCWTDGVDCPNRHVGCQPGCKEFKVFRDAIDKANAERRKNDIGAQYAADMIWRDRQKLKHTADGRRVLGQR